MNDMERGARRPRQIQAGGAASSFGVAVLVLSLLALPLTAFGQSEGSETGVGFATTADDDASGTGHDDGGDRRRLALRLLPLLRVGLGPGIAPGQQQIVFLDCDVAVAGRFNTIPGRVLRFEIVPELGYAFHGGEPFGGHYGTLGFGLRLGSIWVAGSTVTTALLGASEGSFDVGVRAGFRLEVLLGLLGLEVDYESRNLGDEPVHGLHIVFTVDAALILMPMLLTRLGWSMGGRS